MQPRWRQRRDWDDLIILTTLFHLFAMSRALPGYSVLVAASTVASVAWHREQETDVLLGLLDYGLAGLWFMVDASMSWKTVPLNLAVAALNMMLHDHHAEWHLLSAAKAIVVTHLLLTDGNIGPH